MPVTLAISMGDPAGIGPEIIAKAIDFLRPRLEGGEIALAVCGTVEAFPSTLPKGVRLEDISGRAKFPGVSVTLGKVQPRAGALAYAAIERAVELATLGEVAAIVTAPLNKEALHLAGYNYAGHTELLADLTGIKVSVMLLAHGNFRVSHLTTHIALEDVPRRLTAERLRHVVALTADGLKRLGIGAPRIAIAALNPHAGEGGIFGRQDIDVTAPAVAQMRAEGLDVDGPVPGDTVFVKHRAGQYDAVVAMYHDQGHIPVKLLGFEVDPLTGKWTALSGVNITLGLPIVRTSVDHGTAFDIAGKGIASPASLIEAIDMAVTLGSPGKPAQ